MAISTGGKIGIGLSISALIGTVLYFVVRENIPPTDMELALEQKKLRNVNTNPNEAGTFFGGRSRRKIKIKRNKSKK